MACCNVPIDEELTGECPAVIRLKNGVLYVNLEDLKRFVNREAKSHVTKVSNKLVTNALNKNSYEKD